MSETLGKPTSSRSKSSSAGSRARMLARLVIESVSKVSGRGSGVSLRASSPNFAQLLSSSRTSRRSARTGSRKSSATLPRAGTTRSGTLYRLPPSAPRISASVFSSSAGSPHVCEYPTPTASSYGSSGNGAGNNKESRARPSLAAMMKAHWRSSRSFPTPTVTDARQRGVCDPNKKARGYGWSLVDVLNHADIMYPTPLATELRRGPNQRDRLVSLRTVLVSLEASPSGESLLPATGLVPNPRWVELLMGFPAGWCQSPGSEAQLELIPREPSRS